MRHKNVGIRKMKITAMLSAFMVFCTLSMQPVVAHAVVQKAAVPHHDAHPAAHAALHSSVRQTLRKLLPDETISVDMVRGAVVLSGAVTSGEVANKAVKIARQFVRHDSHILNFMQIRTGQQVLLRVRVGEVDRKALHSSKLLEQGVHSSSLFGKFSQGGIFKLIAEPNLVAISGETAEFSSGGQIPLPGEGNSISYKSYGIKLSFTPLVLAPNRIRLTVAPELTEIDPSGKQFREMPVFSAHQAKTTVELAPGESFMIAGLLKESEYLRTGSSTVDHKASEIVIAVTPYLVDPTTGGDVRLPTDNFNIASELDHMFIKVLNSKNTAALPTAALSLEGSSGFIAE